MKLHDIMALGSRNGASAEVFDGCLAGGDQPFIAAGSTVAADKFQKLICKKNVRSVKYFVAAMGVGTRIRHRFF
jgi:hypothetical protein